ncbi:MAG TPA: TIGR02996 domain-containing protein [Kofleriaceae bacterium]|nr:TIGR02996 domain-containing protein [Kofleriaceae bacterium]
MTDREQLLELALASDDDAARLVLADWLEQQGDLPRANLIRAQCALARQARWERGAVEAGWEAAALLAVHGARFAGELPRLPGVEWADFERGFATTARVRDARTLREHADAIAAVRSIYRVEVRDLDESEVAWSEDGLPWLRTLRLSGHERHTVQATRSLISMPRELELTGLGDYHEIEWIDRRAGGVPLTRLRIEGNHTVGRRFAEQLAAWPGAASLERLELGTAFVDYDSGYFSDPTLRAEGARALAGARLGSVAALELDRQRIGSDGLAELVRGLPALRELSARACEISEVACFERSTGAPLRYLDLSENELGGDGARTLMRSPRLAALESLALETCEFPPEGVAAIVEAPCWRTLRVLDLSRNPIGVGGLLAFAEAPRPPHLHTLRLADADLHADAGGILASIDWLPALLVLDLSRNELGGRAVPLGKRLAAPGAATRKLSLARMGLTAAAAAALAPLWERLVHLELEDAAIGDAGLAALVTEGASDLHTLALRGCGLTDASIALLAGRAKLPRLHALSLRDGRFSPAAIARLTASPLAHGLRSLDLRDCQLSADAAAVLADAPALAALHTLDLRDNALDEASLVRLARSPSLRAVGRIRLNGTPWELDEAARTLLEQRFGAYWYYDED